MIGKTSRMNFCTLKKETRSKQYTSANSFQDTAQQQSSKFLCVETLKILVYSTLIENEQTLRQPIFDASQTIQYRAGSL
jgi:hypothetical protein